MAGITGTWELTFTKASVDGDCQAEYVEVWFKDAASGEWITISFPRSQWVEADPTHYKVSWPEDAAVPGVYTAAAIAGTMCGSKAEISGQINKVISAP